MTFQSQKILHIGILTHNAEETAKAWAECLKIQMPEITRLKAEIEYQGERLTPGLAETVFQIGDVQIELLEPTDEVPSVWKDDLNQKGEGIHHLAFRTENLEKVVEQGEENGMRLLQTGTYDTGRYVYLSDIQNTKVVFEFMEEGAE